MKLNYVRFKELDSTNNFAKQYASEGGALPALIISSRQSDGRGRMGRRFESNEETGLYMTVVLKAPKNNAFLRMTALCAVCASESIKRLFGLQTYIKWVNDIYYNSKKVGGILAESFFVDDERYVAVGFGINLYTEFTGELKDIATSLFYGYPDSYTLNAQKDVLADNIAERLLEALEADDLTPYMEKYRALSCVLGKRVSFVENGATYTGTATDITDEGALVVETLDGSLKHLTSGEISVRVER